MKMFGSRNTAILLAALLLAGCAREPIGPEKTPLRVKATLSDGPVVTKASANEFADGDQLLVYFRHLDGSGNNVVADHAPQLVTFTADGLGDIAPSSPLYWDDFSDSSSDGTDLRTAGHGLQAYYGYCYNGGTPSTDLVNATGVLGWTIDDQNSATAVLNSDLLWCNAQTKVSYAHTASQGGDHGDITLPFSHAMSQITVTLTADATFTTSAPLASTAITLNAMNTVTSFTAPAGTFTSSTPDSVLMYADADYSSGNIRNYTAIVAPGTKLKVDELLLGIANVDDNDYSLNVTSAMLAVDKWAEGHTVHNDDGTYIYTLPGYNYHLNVTVSKTAISVIATLTGWTDVTATGTGIIEYPDDVVTISVIGGTFQNNSSFKLYYSTDDSYDLNSVFTWDGSIWDNTPHIYWPNQSTDYYFRALASFEGHDNTNGDLIASVAGTSVSQGTIADHHDILWATTPAHTGNPGNQAFTEGQAISPRTGDVPLAFEHAMSKVTIQLETSADAAAVTLAGATIAISNLSVSGSIDIDDGAITPASATSAAIPATAAPITDLVVIPQTIGDTSIVTITLADGTTYKLQLNLCVDSGDDAIEEWERGKSYTYTIHLEKEQITFRALVKDWEEATGSGNANLEWD